MTSGDNQKDAYFDILEKLVDSQISNKDEIHNNRMVVLDIKRTVDDILLITKKLEDNNVTKEITNEILIKVKEISDKDIKTLNETIRLISLKNKEQEDRDNRTDEFLKDFKGKKFWIQIVATILGALMTIAAGWMALEKWINKG